VSESDDNVATAVRIARSDPESLRGLADHWRNRATVGRSVVASTVTAFPRESEQWVGDSRDACARDTQRLCADSDNYHDHLDSASHAVHRYAGELHGARWYALNAIQDWRVGQRDLALSRASGDQALEARAQSTLQRARHQETAAQHTVDGAALRLHGTLAEKPGRKTATSATQLAPERQQRVDDAVAAVEGYDGVFAGRDGNSDELAEVGNKILALKSQGEVDAFLDGVDGEKLNQLGRSLQNEKSRHPAVEHNGMALLFEGSSRSDISSNLLSQASPDRLGIVTAAFPWTQPSFAKTTVVSGKTHPGETPDPLTAQVRYADPGGQLFDGPVTDEQVRQGNFGDCWVVAPMAAMAANNPDLVHNMMRENANGTVSVRIFNQWAHPGGIPGEGEPHWITVTRDLPIDGHGYVVGATGGSTSALWPAYVEKAMASGYEPLDGSAPSTYKALDDGGRVEWSAPYLTGHNPEFLGTDLTAVHKAYDAGQPIVVETGDIPPNLPADLKDAYLDNHQYYVGGFTDDGRVVIRNPWGPESPDMYVNADQFSRYFSGAAALRFDK
jgi:hypothetical protein